MTVGFFPNFCDFCDGQSPPLQKVSSRDGCLHKKRLGLGVPGEMNFHALGQQPFASALTATGEGGAAAFRLHAGAKAMLPFASTF